MKNAVEAKIEAIKRDPLGWAKADEAEVLRTMGSGARYARRFSEDELRDHAAKQLAKAESLLASRPAAQAAAPSSEEMARLARANERTHKIMGY